MDLLTTAQRKLLTSLWIPGLCIPLILIFKDRWIDLVGSDHREPIDFLTYGLITTLIFGWEFIYRREWKNAAIVCGAAFLLSTRYFFQARFELSFYVQYVYIAGVLCASWYAKGKPYPFAKTFVLALLVFLLPHFSDGWNTFVRLFTQNPPAVSEYVAYCCDGLPRLIAIYLVMFLFDRTQVETAYADRLRSKIAGIDKKEFALFFIAGNAVFLACMFGISYRLPQQIGLFLEHDGDDNLRYAGSRLLSVVLPMFFYLFYAPVILRNVVMCRMVTTNQMNRVLCWLAIFPIINLIPFFILFNSEEAEASDEVNAIQFSQARTRADRYLQPRPALLRIALVIGGIAIALQHFLMYYAMGFEHGIVVGTLPVFGIILSLLCVSQIVLFALLYRVNTMVPVLVLGFIELLLFSLPLHHYELGRDAGPAMLAMIPYLLLPMIYQFYKEIFHPSLKGRDAVAAQQQALVNNPVLQ